MSAFRQIAVSAAQRAGAILGRHFDQKVPLTIGIKSKHEIITGMDVASERLILRLIARRFPDHSILSEEQGMTRRSGPYLWIVDPLDGTTNYSFHHPLFAVSIALLNNDELVLGVVYAPAIKELFVAEAGKGTTLNGRRVRVNRKGSIAQSLLVFCHGQETGAAERAIRIFGHFKTAARDVRQLGSASLECAYVATGRAEGYFTPGVPPWDVAAGALLVREAGGRVTDFQGRPWRWEHKKGTDFLATNGRVHQNLLSVVRHV